MTVSDDELRRIIEQWNACHDVPLDQQDNIQTRAVVVWAVAKGLLRPPSEDELMRQWKAEETARLRDALNGWHSRN